MGTDQPSKGQLMREYNARLAEVQPGITEEEVRAILGAPTAVTSREGLSTPTDFFRDIGSMFRFPDDDTDVVWVYADPYRPRVQNYIGFKRGKVRTTWKETLTTERWQELRRGV